MSTTHMPVLLREWRQYRALSQEDLAALAGIQRSTIIDIESGKRVPRPSTLRKLAQGLKVSPEDLYKAP